MSGLRRLFQISLAISGYLLWWLLVRWHLWRPSVSPARWLCCMLERLGTMFLKLSAGARAETGLNQLCFEAATGAHELPAALGAWIHKVRATGLELRLQHHGLEELEEHVDRGSNRVALALVTLGPYIAASLLRQHSIGPRLGEIPPLAAVGYALALWFTWRLARGNFPLRKAVTDARGSRLS